MGGSMFIGLWHNEPKVEQRFHFVFNVTYWI